MSVAALPSSSAKSAAAAALDGVRARGGVAVAFKRVAGCTRLADLHERGGFRAKFPRTHGLCEAVLINTGGGLLGGDSVRFDITVDADAEAQVTTQSAERVYRSLGPDACVDIALSVGSKGRLHWLPQETILFNDARLARNIAADIADDATLLLIEATVFGRAAMAEMMLAGALHDRWRISRGGELIYADTVRIAGDIQNQLMGAAIGCGATAMATLLYIAPDAADRLDAARASLADTSARAAVSSWNGMLAARLLAPSADALKADVVRLTAYLSGYALPRVWGVI